MATFNRTVYRVRRDDYFLGLECIENEETLLVPIDEVDPEFNNEFTGGRVGVTVPDGEKLSHGNKSYSCLFWRGRKVFPYNEPGSE